MNEFGHKLAIFIAGFIAGLLYMALERHCRAKAEGKKITPVDPIFLPYSQEGQKEKPERGTRLDIRA